MLEGFNRPYPGECWYSTMARFADRMRYSKRILKEKAGHRSQMLRLDFPEGLEWFVNQIPSTESLNTSRIIQHYTAYPAFAPFLESSLKARLLAHMRSDSCAGRLVLQNQYLFRSPRQRFRYCLACVQEDRAKYGEAYWHREHQLSGVAVCARHAVFLEAHSDLTWPHPWRDDWIIAERIVRPKAIRRVDWKDSDQKRCFDVAHDMDWVWNYNGPCLGSEDLSERYYWLAAEQRLMTYVQTSMSARCQYELRLFLKKYMEALAENEGAADGLTPFTCYIRSGVVSKHPVYHVLLARFLGQSIESIFNVKEVPKVFGDGPWPCWNKRASHYGKPVVMDCTVVQASANDPPIGTFSCSCGLVYSRAGPDRLLEHAFHQSYIIRREGRDDSTAAGNPDGPLTSNFEMTSLVDHRHICGLGYPSRISVDQRNGTNSLWTPIIETYVLKNRREWLCGTDRGSQTDWRKTCQSVAQAFFALLSDDPDWLSEHVPKYPYPASIQSVWDLLGSRDEVLASAIHAAGRRLRMDPAFRGAINQKSIAHAIYVDECALASLSRHSQAQVELDRTVETASQFARRCIWHALCQFKFARHVPSELEVLRASGLPLSAGESPAVKGVLDFVLHRVCPMSVWSSRGTRNAPRFNKCDRCKDMGVLDDERFDGRYSLEPYLDAYREKDYLSYQEQGDDILHAMMV